MHFVKDMEGVVASPAIIDEDFPCGLFWAGYCADGISRIIDPLRLAWMKATYRQITVEKPIKLKENLHSKSISSKNIIVSGQKIFI